MGWKDNRRRKRTWYRHYRQLCDELVRLVSESRRTGSPIAGEAIIQMFFALFERRRMHKRRRIAMSAQESLKLAAEDSGLTRLGLTTKWYDPAETGPNKRPPSAGEFMKPLRVKDDAGQRMGDMTIAFSSPPVREELARVDMPVETAGQPDGQKIRVDMMKLYEGQTLLDKDGKEFTLPDLRGALISRPNIPFETADQPLTEKKLNSAIEKLRATAPVNETTEGRLLRIKEQGDYVRKRILKGLGLPEEKDTKMDDEDLGKLD